MGSLRSELPPRPTPAETARPAAPAAPLRAVTPRKRAAEPSPAVTEPTVLLVGTDPSFEPALRLAMSRHRVYVETATIESAAETVVVTAPDLVLLVNEAAQHGGRELLGRLAASPASSVVPVAILDDNPELGARLSAFRHGAAAVIPRSASIDAIAEQVARLAREIPERGGEALGQVGESTLNEFVTALGNELRSGILSVQPNQGSPDQAVRLVLGSGRPLAAFIDDFVKRVRRHVVHAEPLRYEFDDRAAGTVRLLDAQAPDAVSAPAALGSLRVALADDDTARADAVAQELRSRGATVVVTDLAPSEPRFARLRQTDPQVLIVGEQHLQGNGYELLRRMRRDTRLRWASLLVVRWHEIWSESLVVPALDRLQSALASLAQADRGLVTLGEAGEPFDTRLEINGPARLLRALVSAAKPVRISVVNPRLHVTLDVSDGLVVGASATSMTEGSTWEGPTALSALLVLSSGRVHVTPVQQPAATNVMATIDVALNMAESEPAPIAPSVPATRGPSLPPGAERRDSVPAEPSAFAAENRPSLLTGRHRGPGISHRTAAILIGLACLQGLVFAAVFGKLSRRSSELEQRSAAASAAAIAAAPSASGATAPASAPPEKSKPEAAANTERAREAPPREGASANAAADESGVVAPTCEGLLAGQGLDEGNFPGAAYEQQRLANKALVRGQVQEAQLAYCKAAKWDAANPRVYVDLAQLALLQRDGAAAAMNARRALAIDPENTRALSLLGDGLVRTGDHAGAKAAWLKSSAIPPDDVREVQALLDRSLREAEASLSNRDPARAERFFRRAIVLDPESAPASRGLAAALWQIGDGEAALRWAQRAVALAPRDSQAHLVLGDALAATGQAALAEGEWREANRLDATNLDAQRRLKRLRRP